MNAKLVVMISGSGTNLQALIDAVGNGRLPAQILCVVSNRQAAYGLTRAQEAGIPFIFPTNHTKKPGAAMPNMTPI
ncbi:MAG: formyltransferase family protein [Chloroflexota bacterium]